MKVGHIDAFFVHYFGHFLRCFKNRNIYNTYTDMYCSSWLIQAHLRSFRLIQTQLSSFQLINYWYKFYLKGATFRGMCFSLIYIKGFLPRKFTQFLNNPNIDGNGLIPGHLDLFEPIWAYLGSYRLIWGHLTTFMLI